MAEPRNEDELPTMSISSPAPAGGPEGDVPRIEGYKVTGSLGAGGMGAVYRAVELNTRREVALKLLAVHRLNSPKARARFEREVELASRLEHPNIARIYHSGLVEGVYYYAMELIDGVPLNLYCHENHLSQMQFLELMQTVCRAVQYAHHNGVIHRDLKPSNILVSPDGRPHIVDFGLAKSYLSEGDQDFDISITGEVEGTPAYMSPEQAAGQHNLVDTRTDVYALGVMLFRRLTGDPPHSLVGGQQEVLRRIAEEEVPRPRAVSRDVDKELEAIVLKALARNPEQRYGTAGELAQDLANYIAGDRISARKPTPGDVLLRVVRRYPAALGIGLTLLAVMVDVAVVAYVRINQERVGAEQKAQAARRESYLTEISSASRFLFHGDLLGALEHLDMAQTQAALCTSDPRDWEWHWLNGVLARARDGSDVPQLSGPSIRWPGRLGDPRCATFADDGNWAMVGDSKGSLWLWSAAGPRSLWRRPGGGGAVLAVRCGPGAVRMAVCAPGGALEAWSAPKPGWTRGWLGGTEGPSGGSRRQGCRGTTEVSSYGAGRYGEDSGPDSLGRRLGCGREPSDGGARWMGQALDIRARRPGGDRAAAARRLGPGSGPGRRTGRVGRCLRGPRNVGIQLKAQRDMDLPPPVARPLRGLQPFGAASGDGR